MIKFNSGYVIININYKDSELLNNLTIQEDGYYSINDSPIQFKKGDLILRNLLTKYK